MLFFFYEQNMQDETPAPVQSPPPSTTRTRTRVTNDWKES